MRGRTVGGIRIWEGRMGLDEMESVGKGSGEGLYEMEWVGKGSGEGL